MSVNKVVLVGNVGCVPTFKEFDNGGCVVQFTLATTDKERVLSDGTKIPEHTEWHNIIASNGIAKAIIEYVNKGDRIYIDGKIKTRSYDDSAGIKRYVTEIYVTHMELMSTKHTTEQSKQ